MSEQTNSNYSEFASWFISGVLVSFIIFSILSLIENYIHKKRLLYTRENFSRTIFISSILGVFSLVWGVLIYILAWQYNYTFFDKLKNSFVITVVLSLCVMSFVVFLIVTEKNKKGGDFEELSKEQKTRRD